MPLLLSCPSCTTRLKVADRHAGHKVRCRCGHIFVAPGSGSAWADRVIVACGGCRTTLKVPEIALGKKVRCPTCSAIFVASSPAVAVHGRAAPDGSGHAGEMAPATRR